MSDEAELGNLPALKGLGKLADLRPTVVIDVNEKTPLVFTRLPSVVASLYTGDYSYLGGEMLFSVERKSISDMVGCCCDSNRTRFEYEMHRLRGFPFGRLVVVGTRAEIEAGQYRSETSPKAVLATIDSFEMRYGVAVDFCATPELAARLIEKWAWRSAYETVKNANTLLRGSTPPKPPEK